MTERWRCSDLLRDLVVHLEGPELQPGGQLCDGGQGEEELLCWSQGDVRVHQLSILDPLLLLLRRDHRQDFLGKEDKKKTSWIHTRHKCVCCCTNPSDTQTHTLGWRGWTRVEGGEERRDLKEEKKGRLDVEMGEERGSWRRRGKGGMEIEMSGGRDGMFLIFQLFFIINEHICYWKNNNSCLGLQPCQTSDCSTFLLLSVCEK